MGSDNEGSGWGCWQTRLACLLALPVLLTGAYGTNYVFLAAKTPYRCVVPECETINSSMIISSEEWSPLWSKWSVKDSCHRWKPLDDQCEPYSFDNSTALSCERFVYQHGSSIASEFNLACQERLLSLVGSVHNLGMLISLPIIGYVSDRWGRRTALVVSGVGAGVLGLVKSFTPSVGLYLLAELLETVMGASVYPAAFVLMIEWLGVKHRILASLVLGIPLSVGAATLSLLDYLTGYWRLWARVAYPPSFILLLYPWVLPESVRWLSTKGRHSEALAVVEEAARWNRVHPSCLQVTQEALHAKNDDQKNEDESLFEAFKKYSALRRRLCVCFSWWFSAVFVFYGLAVSAHSLSGSAHVNYALVAAAELPALVLNTLLLDRVGRRPVLTAGFLLTAISLISKPVVAGASSGLATTFYLLGKVGATMALNTLYVYSSELFPTRARQRLLAACSTCGRLGAILAPFVLPLLESHTWLPPVALSVGPLVGAGLTLLLPDTLHGRLPDVYADLDTHKRDVTVPA